MISVKQKQSLASICILLGSLLIVDFAWTREHPQQDDEISQIKFIEPFSNGLSVKMKEFLGLKIEGGQLRLIRAWPSADSVPDGEFNRRRYSTASAFTQATRELGCNRSGGSYSLADKTVNNHTSGETHSAQFIADDQSMRFTFWRNAAPFQRFSFEDSDNGAIRILYVSDNDAVQLNQLPDGRINLKVILETKAEVFSSENYEKFLQQHDKVTQKVLLPLLEHLGIGAPLHRGSAEVKNYVVAQIRFAKKFHEFGFKRAVADLASKDFETRKKANDIIKEGMHFWEADITRYLADESSPMLSRAFLEQIVRKKKTNRTQKLVSENNLMKSKDYLFDLMKDSGADDKDAIFQHLLSVNSDVTNEQLIEDYQDWLDKNDRPAGR